MVAIIETGDISELLDRRHLRRNQDSTSVHLRRTNWTTAKPQAALLVDAEGDIRWMGRAIPASGYAQSDTHRRINITEISAVWPPVPLSEIDKKVKLKVGRNLAYGLQENGVGRHLLAAVSEFYPELRDELSRLGRPRDVQYPRSDRTVRLNEQRDATGLLLDIAGVGREKLREAAAITEDLPSFLRALPDDREVSEESLINNDVSVIPGMLSIPGVHVDWRMFTQGSNRIHVANANMEPLERTLGVDVIYYNQPADSFVLVQYKRLRKEGEGGWWYRPDKQFNDEMDRMRRVDGLCGPAPDDDFRLHSEACWIKLCDPSSTVENPESLIRGMYLPRVYFKGFIESSKSLGPKGGRRIGWDNVDRYLNNTHFIEMVKAGWIGTHGEASKHLAGIVQEGLHSRKSVVIGAELGPPSSSITDHAS